MGNCKDCKWWDKPEGYNGNWGQCRMTWTNTDSRHKESLAFAFSADCEPIALDCRCNFGCVQFEGNPSEKAKVLAEMTIAGLYDWTLGEDGQG